jgi:hypothetical protein
MGYDISFEEVKAKADGVVGRPHIAMVLMEKYPKEFPDMVDVFRKLLGRGKPAYIPREAGFGIGEAIDLIHGARGLSFLCHPFIYPYDPAKLVSDFNRLGGDGLEVYYDYVANRPEVKISYADNKKLMAQAQSMAKKHGLLVSGGSDFHGRGKRGHQNLGEFGAPDDVLQAIKEGGGKAL